MAVSSSSKPAPKKVDKKDNLKPFKIEKGAFHKWLGKKPGAPLTDEDIDRGMRAPDPHVRRMAQFAKNARDGKFKGKKAAGKAKGKGKPIHESIGDTPAAWNNW